MTLGVSFPATLGSPGMISAPGFMCVSTARVRTCEVVIRIHESHIFVLRKIHFKQMKIITVYTQLKQLRNKA